MKKYNYETEIQIKNFFGGTVRWFLVYFYNIILKKEKPNRKDFISGPKQEEDYFGYKNTIATIVSSFIIFVLIAKLFKILF